MSAREQIMVATPIRNIGNPYELGILHPSFGRIVNDLTQINEDKDGKYEFVFTTIDMGVVPARNRLVSAFRKSGMKWLLFVDYDIEATGADVLALLSRKLPLIGGLYTTREEHPHWVASFLFEAPLQKETVLQVVECGTGLKLYHREVFDKLEAAYPQIGYIDRDSGEKLCAFFQHCVVYHDLQKEGDLLPEDYFCDFLCRQAQISIWVDTAVKVRHRDPDGVLHPKDWPAIPGLEPTDEPIRIIGKQ